MYVYTYIFTYREDLISKDPPKTQDDSERDPSHSHATIPAFRQHWGSVRAGRHSVTKLCPQSNELMFTGGSTRGRTRTDKRTVVQACYSVTQEVRRED